MAVAMDSQFSLDGKYFAQISTDGKLKVWNTHSNTFEQEFTTDFHLASPCTCLHFIQTDSLKYKGGSPKKKKRRESESNVNFSPNIALGTASGVLMLYSITNANLDCTINSPTNQPLRCLSTVDQNVIYSGAEHDVLVWNLEKKKMVKKWKTGNEKIVSILAIPENNQLLTAAKNIKLWDIEAQSILRTFTGHKSEVMFLHYVCSPTSGESYFISGSKGDRILSCWSLSDSSSDKNAIATFLMEDIVNNISISVNSEGTTNMAATVRSGVVHIYRHTLNGKLGKPIKPVTTVQVVSDASQTEEIVNSIRIFGAAYRDDETLCIGYGSEILLTFENVVFNTSKKLQCLVRQDPRNLTGSKQDRVTKIITPVVGDNVQYLTPGTSRVTTVKRKNDGTLEVPMEKRLENLTLEKTEKSVPRADNVSHLLIQGLHSKDNKILKSVLYQKDEEVIRNTVKRLSVAALIPLIQELTKYIQGKTLSSHIGSLWLKHLIQMHSGILMSNPELPELVGSALGSIESRLALLTPLNRLKGRLDLILPQVRGSSKEEISKVENALLVYNDRESSDSDQGEDTEMDQQSESGSEWEEESDVEQIQENHVDQDSEADMDDMSD